MNANPKWVIPATNFGYSVSREDCDAVLRGFVLRAEQPGIIFRYKTAVGSLYSPRITALLWTMRSIPKWH